MRFEWHLQEMGREMGRREKAVLGVRNNAVRSVIEGLLMMPRWEWLAFLVGEKAPY